jgi:hypothetical protein
VTDETEQLLSQAYRLAQAHLEALPERRPYPAPAALQALAGFDEAWPEEGVPPQEAIAQLDALGSPAAVAMNGGR